MFLSRGAKVKLSPMSANQNVGSEPLKVVVFAHVPPPHHGQSYIVALMLNGFGGDRRQREFRKQPANHFGIECYHVNARFSRGLEDIGQIQSLKLARLFWYCVEAIWCRFRHGVRIFYYVPAPGKRAALYRDWLVMLFCRPFFDKVILHWHAAGLAKWLETSAQITARAITYRLYKPVDLSIVLSKYTSGDAEKFLSHRICRLNYGIPDPCPDFATAVLPRRRARLAARQKLFKGESLEAGHLSGDGGDPRIMNILYLAHCTREKGLFDTLEGAALANAELARKNSPLQMRLTVAGEFFTTSEQAEFNERVTQLGMNASATCIGFVSGERKQRAFIESDCFCFPTYYHAESFGLVVVEAMAFGLPIVTTRWRSLPEILPSDYPCLVDTRSPEQIADALLRLVTSGVGDRLREIFLRNFTLESYLTGLATAFRSVDSPVDDTSIAPFLQARTHH